MPRREITPGRACLECRRRKIKCDRSHPCSYCVKVRIGCKYPALRRAGDEHDALNLVAALESKVASLEKRLVELEEPLLSGSLKLSEQHEGSITNSAARSNEDRVYTGQGTLIDRPGVPPAAVGARSAMLLHPQAPVNLDLFRPAPQAIAALWQKYLEIVDPLLKIFHTPSVQRLVMHSIQGRGNLDLATECLLFAIYYASVAAMNPEVCQSELEEDRLGLLRRVRLVRYQAAVENILSRLNLLNTTDMTVLQAFAIYLITGRNDPNGPDVYALVGLAVGMALKMGLNQDGEAQGYQPFDVEMRRRLWWQLLTLDTRVAEDRGSEPCILESSFSTRLPLSIADSDLHPAMSRLPDRRQGRRTEMLFSLVRFEGSYFARQMVFSEKFGAENSYARLSSTEKRHAIDLFQERIEKQYFKYCDGSIPLDRVTVQSIRLVLAKLRLVVRRGAEDEENTLERGQASLQSGWIQILQNSEAFRGYEAGKQWLWLFQAYIELDSLVHLLQHLRADSSGDQGDEGWEIANRAYSCWNENETVPRDARWKGIEELWSEVLGRRQVAGITTQ
ncbi:fungal-specific transcription factor domain-containing protein [Aspergillus desertorum]